MHLKQILITTVGRFTLFDLDYSTLVAFTVKINNYKSRANNLIASYFIYLMSMSYAPCIRREILALGLVPIPVPMKLKGVQNITLSIHSQWGYRTAWDL